MLRVLEHGAARADLDDLAQVHHRHAVADALDHRHVVRDEEVGHAELLLQIEQQVDDLRADGHVQRRHRFVGDHHLGVERQRAGNRDALALPARKLMRVAVRRLGGQAHLFQQPAHTLFGLVGRHQLVDEQRLHHRIAHRQARVERGIRVLEHELDVTPQRLQRGAFQRRDVAAGHFHPTALVRDQPRQRTAGGALAAARLTHQRQRFAGLQLEADLLDRMHLTLDAAEHAAAQRKARDQLVHLEYRRQVVAHAVGHQNLLGRAGRGHAGRQLARHQEARGQVLPLHRAQLRHRGQQRPGVGLGGRGEQRAAIALLDLVATLHHQHAVGDLGHHAHVVGDEDHAHRQLLLQLADQRQDLRLDGDVERGGGLVGDQQRGPAGQRHRDHHPLAHAARQLVRVAAQHLARFWNAHQVEEAQRLGHGLGLRAALVQHDAFGDLLADGEHRVQAGHRLLEHHRDVGAAQRAHLRAAGLRQVDAFAIAAGQPHLAAVDAAAAMLHQPHQRQ